MRRDGSRSEQIGRRRVAFDPRRAHQDAGFIPVPRKIEHRGPGTGGIAPILAVISVEPQKKAKSTLSQASETMGWIKVISSPT